VRQPELTFVSELDVPWLTALFAGPSVVPDLQALRARVLLMLADYHPQRAGVVKELNRARVPVVGVPLVPADDGPDRGPGPRPEPDPAPSLTRMCSTWAATVRGAMTSAAAMRALVRVLVQAPPGRDPADCRPDAEAFPDPVQRSRRTQPAGVQHLDPAPEVPAPEVPPPSSPGLPLPPRPAPGPGTARWTTPAGPAPPGPPARSCGSPSRPGSR
jgi:hypothetical protein